jgi:hypothetical protein
MSLRLAIFSTRETGVECVAVLDGVTLWQEKLNQAEAGAVRPEQPSVGVGHRAVKAVEQAGNVLEPEGSAVRGPAVAARPRVHPRAAAVNDQGRVQVAAGERQVQLLRHAKSALRA